jgi:multidrug transporter EmrE-like cation transporter
MMNLITLFAGAGFFVTIGDLVLAQWARTSNHTLLVLGLLLNITGIAFYANTLRFESVGLATAIFLGINIIAVTIGGYFFLNQSLTARELTGLLLLAFAIVVVEI